MNFIKRIFKKAKPELTTVKLLMLVKTSPQYLEITWNDNTRSQLNIN